MVAGRFAELVRLYKAPPAHALSEDFYETDAKRGFARGLSCTGELRVISRVLSRIILPGLHRGAVIEFGIPVAATLRSQVHEMPMGREQVDTALLDVWCHPRMRSIEMAQGVIRVAGENGNGGVLMYFAVLAA